ncbi:hypothetical protein QJS66_05200 [Kocuria rhizophila]|nr:hypothetical protein QJS66_05200 [Kocuria rhizophila]
MVLDYIREWVPEAGGRPWAATSVGTDELPEPGHAQAGGAACTTGSSTSPRSRSLPAAGTRGPTSRRRAGRPPRAGRHRGLDRRAALLPPHPVPRDPGPRPTTPQGRRR